MTSEVAHVSFLPEVIAQIWLDPLKGFWGWWETFINNFGCREISLIPQKQLEEISTELDIQQFESVDQIVTGEINAIDSDNFNKKMLMDIYNELWYKLKT